MEPPASITAPEEQRLFEPDNEAEVGRNANARPQRAVKTANSPEFQPWAGQVPSQHFPAGDVNLVPPSRDAAIVGDMVPGMPNAGDPTATEDGAESYLGGKDLLTAGADQYPDVKCVLDVEIADYPNDRAAQRAGALKHQTGRMSF